MGCGKGHEPTGQAPHLPMVQTPVVVMAEHVHEMLPRPLDPTAGFCRTGRMGNPVACSLLTRHGHDLDTAQQPVRAGHGLPDTFKNMAGNTVRLVLQQQHLVVLGAGLVHERVRLVDYGRQAFTLFGCPCVRQPPRDQVRFHLVDPVFDQLADGARGGEHVLVEPIRQPYGQLLVCANQQHGVMQQAVCMPCALRASYPCDVHCVVPSGSGCSLRIMSSSSALISNRRVMSDTGTWHFVHVRAISLRCSLVNWSVPYIWFGDGSGFPHAVVEARAVRIDGRQRIQVPVGVWVGV